MVFHEVRFPTEISRGAVGGPERRTDVVVLGSGHEERNSRWADSRRSYNAGYGVKSLDELPASDVLSSRQIDEWLKSAMNPATLSDTDMGLADEQLPLETAATESEAVANNADDSQPVQDSSTQA